MANKDKGGSKSSKTTASKSLKGKAPGEEGESSSFRLFLDGILDQQVSPRSQTDKVVCHSGSLRRRTTRAVPLLGPIELRVRPPTGPGS